LEERGMMIQQRFKVTQTRSEGSPDLVNPVYYEVAEAHTVNPAVGEDVPFSFQVEYPRLSLASSFTHLNFKPDNSHNSTDQNVEVESLLSPFLCSKRKFENVVAVPRVTPQWVSTVQRQSFTAQVGFHGRFWFGLVTDTGVPDPVESFGVLPAAMPPQVGLNLTGADVSLGENGCGEIQFYKTPEGGWRSSAVEITVPLGNLFFDAARYQHNEEGTYLIPELELEQKGKDYYLDKSTILADFTTQGGRAENIFKVPVGTIKWDMPADQANGIEKHHTSHVLYMFIPRFRYREGSLRPSYSHPIRIHPVVEAGGGEILADLQARPYTPHGRFYPNPTIEGDRYVLNAADRIANWRLQTPYWANFFSRQKDGENMWEAFPVFRCGRDANTNTTYLQIVPVTHSSEDSEALTNFKTRVEQLVQNMGNIAVPDRFTGGGQLRAIRDLGEVLFLNIQEAPGGVLTIPDIPVISRIQIMDLNTYGASGVNPTQITLDQSWEAGLLQADRVNAYAIKHGPWSATDNQLNAFAGVRKQFIHRGVFTIRNSAVDAQNNLADNVLTADNRLLCLPFRKDAPVTSNDITSFDVSCCEPFFSYGSATTILGLEHPLDTARLGRLYPSLIQDYTISSRRDYSKLVPSSLYQHDSGCELVIKPEDPKLVTFRERDDFIQSDKSVSRVGEVSHTIVTSSSTYNPGDTPTIELETRQGQFEYVFLYCRIPPQGMSLKPTTEPIISSLRYFVRGKENLLTKNLDSYDLEQMSRRNCHELSDWRKYHSQGRGILLHLGDLGLTESVPYGARDRLKLKFQLLTTIDPPVETLGTESTQASLLAPRVFSIALLRFNRLLSGSMSEGCRFSYLNERSSV